MILNQIWDFYGGNPFDVQKLLAAGVEVAGHKIGSWPRSRMAAETEKYKDRKAAWQATGKKWFCYFLPFSHQSAQTLWDSWMLVESDPTIAYAIDWEDDGSGSTVSQDVIENLAMRFFLHFGWWPIIYGSNTLTEAWKSSILSKCTAWYAQPQPKGTPAPTVFNPRHEPANFDVQWWQWTQDGDPASLALGGGDGNAYDGTQEDFNKAYPRFDVRTSIVTSSSILK
jgi:hypothetical protein